MRDGICPKCHSHEVRYGDNAYGVTIPPLRDHVPVEHYMCISCGYLENYIPDIPSLDTIAAAMPRAYDLQRR
jgi:predicted nucleic-acid-binding Zn-ribbon protein